MIGWGLRKLAKNYGLFIRQGVAYGSMEGYSVTLFEGAGFKQVTFSYVFEREEDMIRFAEQIDEGMFEKNRIIECTITRTSLSLTFYDNPGTMKRITGYLSYLLPILRNSKALGSDYCYYCKRLIDTQDSWKLIGTMACRYHSDCAGAAVKEMLAEWDADQEAEGKLEIKDLT